MAVSSVFSPRPALLVCACLVLAPLARAAAPASEAPPAPVVQPVPAAPAAAAVPSAPLAAPAEPDLGTPMEGMGEQNESLSWMLIRTLLLFGAVLGTIYLTLNVGLRKLMGLQGVNMRRANVVSVVERVALDQRQTLFVLKAADEYLLVGGGEKGLQLLSKLDTDAVERIRAVTPAAPTTPMTPFLQKLLARRATTPQGLTQPSGSPPPGA